MSEWKEPEDVVRTETMEVAGVLYQEFQRTVNLLLSQVLASASNRICRELNEGKSLEDIRHRLLFSLQDREVG